MLKRFSFLIFLISLAFEVQASHIRGGSITYSCVSGNYIFELVLYRNCNDADINPVSEQLKVWNHPSLNTINLNFFSRTDVSPTCSPVAGSPVPFLCGSGANSGNGLGAVEKIIYRSVPTQISGIPPANGWIFTFDYFSRNPAIINLQNPNTYGITLVTKIFNSGNSSNICKDNSVKFLQEPHFVSCAGEPFTMNFNVVDPDMDSIAMSFENPLDFLNALPYNGITNPANIPFEVGFSVNNPTPDNTFNAGNIASTINSNSGAMTFLSNTVGSYAIKVRLKSYRAGLVISEVDYEIQLDVTNCSSANNAPVITPPFAGSFETTVNAGDLVTFNLQSTDVELLQNGSPQQNSILASSIIFGTNTTSALGCDTPPCATLSAPPPVTGVQGASVNFNWQTDCDHLIDGAGNAVDVMPYYFVFNVKDNFCQVPGITYATVKVNVVNPNVIQAPNIDCIQGSGTGDFTLQWQPVADPNGSFIEYQIHSVQDGLIASIPAIGTSSYTHTGVTQETEYFIAVVSGCGGTTIRYGDTISCIYLDVSNLNPGTAVLSWNRPINPALPGMYGYTYIFREYPAGTWVLQDSVPYNTTTYQQEIDNCNINLNYQIQLTNVPCDFSSQIDGGLFNDQTPPSIPIVSSVTIDTLTGETTITWSENDKPDTQGYLIYVEDVNGFLIELDTVYGISNTSYTYLESYTNGPLTYTVAALDSCPSVSGAPFNLSARDPNFHTTVFLRTQVSLCSSETVLNWSAYLGWSSGVLEYEIYKKAVGGAWVLAGTTPNLTFSSTEPAGLSYCYAIKAKHADGRFSFSNVACTTVGFSTAPTFSYIRNASVIDDDWVSIEYSYSPGAKVSQLDLQRINYKTGLFETIETVLTPQETTFFKDSIVEVDDLSYTYRVLFYDSCGLPGYFSNSVKTVLLEIVTDDIALKNSLTWSSYEGYLGSVVGYSIYRGIDGVYTGFPIATVGTSQRSYEDDMTTWDFSGKVCYYVEAIEGSNIFNSTRYSNSNSVCPVVDPLIYIPNAFLQNGINESFKPVITNFKKYNYQLLIFDRWGQVIFETRNYDEAWNGRFNNTGKLVEFGTYVYMVVLQDGGGSEIVKRGYVSYLR